MAVMADSFSAPVLCLFGFLHDVRGWETGFQKSCSWRFLFILLLGIFRFAVVRSDLAESVEADRIYTHSRDFWFGDWQIRVNQVSGGR
jgi:hypothetical protein